MDKILDAAFKIIEGLAEGLINALPKLIDALPKILSSIINFITDNLPEIIKMGIEVTVQLAAGLIKAIPQLVSQLPQIVTAIIKGIGQAALSIVDIGKNIVQGLWNGIASMITWIWDKISDFVGGIVSGVKGVLGIQSPSTVFAGIGDNMALGLGQGFDKAMGEVSKDIQSAIPTDLDIKTRLNIDSIASTTNEFRGSGSGIQTNEIKHTGTIRVEGVNDEQQLIGVSEVVVEDILVRLLRREARLA
jgi:phage-related protein